MLPSNDKESQTFWLWAWGAAATILAGLLSAAYAWIWATIPDKRYVDGQIAAAEGRMNERIQRGFENDEKRDRDLFDDKIAPIAERIESIQRAQEVNRHLQDTRHGENQIMLGEILKEVRALRGE